MVLNASETAAIGDSDGTGMKLDAGKRSKMLGVEWMSQIVTRMGRGQTNASKVMAQAQSWMMEIQDVR